MATTFSSLPIIDLSPLHTAQLAENEIATLSKQFGEVFSTTGFAYLVNPPLSFDHEEMFAVAREFFALPTGQKMQLAKRSFRPTNENTYRGYFPTQPHLASDNLKEGFEIGSAEFSERPAKPQKIVLSEPNVWPNKDSFSAQSKLEQMYDELQSLAAKLLSLLAVSLGKPPDAFSSWLTDSLSTLRLLHYPALSRGQEYTHDESVKLSCTPHTDSGILTLLHQDSTGGLEVLNASGEWVSAPYVPGSIVVNIGDLMTKVSGGRFTATMHRVRAPAPKSQSQSQSPNDGFGRFSIPFFFEPGEDCVIVPALGDGEAVVYGEHVRRKMSTWVEFQEDSGYDTGTTEEI
ncbi:oxidoreductase [Lophiostoma macrostomum CBS 122681]|uniref:Oxidoreductase n=1 Tax=Lophiostoma macrostomum CBS 122681 TaxID=1314788 RepID=A0A6A6TJC5_9PLEO|nr:oxidoreductase [Lophiostoma macrostomum CBS 122681]